MPSSFMGKCGLNVETPQPPDCASRGALGAGLVFFSRFPIMGATSHPYSLAGSPLDVLGGDWFVGKAVVSVLLAHPVLGKLQVFNTHVSRFGPRLCPREVNIMPQAIRKRWGDRARIPEGTQAR